MLNQIADSLGSLVGVLLDFEHNHSKFRPQADNQVAEYQQAQTCEYPHHTADLLRLNLRLPAGKPAHHQADGKQVIDQ